MFNSFVEMCNQFEAHIYYRRVLWDLLECTLLKMYLVKHLGRDLAGVIDMKVRIKLKRVLIGIFRKTSIGFI
jgi:hypothetical protein